MTFTSRGKGIEQLVANDIVSPPGGKPIVAAWDRTVFFVANPDVFPIVHGPDDQTRLVTGLGPRLRRHRSPFIVGLMNWWGVEKSGYSTDRGKMWKGVAEYPPIIDNKIGR
jgi:hypothetical protein